MQLKEQKFLSLYDYVLNIIAMFSIFMSLLLGAQQVYIGQLNEVYLTSIVLMVLTLFEQAVPMSNVAFYKAGTDQALDEINEVIAPVTTEMSEISNNNHSELSLFEMKDITFSYWNQQTPTLHGINITIEEGEKVAIIGPSGSGKNTLLQVLLGLFQVRKGVVTLNGEQVYDIDNTKEYHRINAMLQSQHMFDGTVRHNLFSDKNDEDLIRVLKAIGLYYLDLDRVVSFGCLI